MAENVGSQVPQSSSWQSDSAVGFLLVAFWVVRTNANLGYSSLEAATVEHLKCGRYNGYHHPDDWGRKW